jgi:NIPSNAP
MLGRTIPIATKRSNSFRPAAARLLSTAHPVVELREYQLQCGNSAQYIEVTAAAEKLRKSLVPLRLFCAPDTGGLLNMMTHFYFYEGGLEQREAARIKAAKSTEWKDYLSKSRPNILQQRSSIYVESPLLQKHGLSGMKTEFVGHSSAPGAPSDVIYEIRKYQLKLGYDTVPQFMSMYDKGLPSKLSAPGTDPSTSLCSVMYNEVGDLNTVIEIWRHGGGVRAMHTSRVAARGAMEWRKAINDIATLSISFTTTIHKPLPFSNWK